MSARAVAGGARLGMVRLPLPRGMVRLGTGSRFALVERGALAAEALGVGALAEVAGRDGAALALARVSTGGGMTAMGIAPVSSPAVEVVEVAAGAEAGESDVWDDCRHCRKLSRAARTVSLGGATVSLGGTIAAAGPGDEAAGARSGLGVAGVVLAGAGDWVARTGIAGKSEVARARGMASGIVGWAGVGIVIGVVPVARGTAFGAGAEASGDGVGGSVGAAGRRAMASGGGATVFWGGVTMVAGVVVARARGEDSGVIAGRSLPTAGGAEGMAVGAGDGGSGEGAMAGGVVVMVARVAAGAGSSAFRAVWNSTTPFRRFWAITLS